MRLITGRGSCTASWYRWGIVMVPGLIPGELQRIFRLYTFNCDHLCSADDIILDPAYNTFLKANCFKFWHQWQVRNWVKCLSIIEKIMTFYCFEPMFYTLDKCCYFSPTALMLRCCVLGDPEWLGYKSAPPVLYWQGDGVIIGRSWDVRGWTPLLIFSTEWAAGQLLWIAMVWYCLMWTQHSIRYTIRSTGFWCI